MSELSTRGEKEEAPIQLLCPVLAKGGQRAELMPSSVWVALCACQVGSAICARTQLLLLSCFSLLRLCATPQTATHQAPLSLGFPGKNTGVGCHFVLQCMKMKSESEVARSRPTLRDPMDCSLPGSSVHGIFQARVLEWVAIAFSGNFGA